jgi:hypothetical protein
MMKRSLILMVAFYLTITQITFAQQRLYKPATPMNIERQMYGATVLGDYLYLIGGNSPGKNYVKSVEKALIKPDGSLGIWQETTPLPSGRSYIENATLALNDIVYIVGGYDGILNRCPNTILWSKPRRGGHLTPWSMSKPYPGRGIQCSVAVATSGYIHLIGGIFNDNTPINLVWVAKIESDGTISGWEKGAPLPTTLWYHNGAVAGGKVWVWGGLMTKNVRSVNTAIYFADILSSGKLGPWQKSRTPLKKGFYAASCTVSGSYLFSFCPRYAGRVISNDIWFTSVGTDGISKWCKIATDLKAKLFLGLATDYRKGNIYIPGGRTSYTIKNSICKDVNFFTLDRGQQKDTNTDSATMASTGQSPEESQLSYTRSQQKGAFPGFRTLNQARQMDGRPMALYFHTKKAKRCKEQAQILAGFNVSVYGTKVVFAEMDTLQYPQIAQQYGVFRVPTWMFFDAYGNKKISKLGVLQVQDIGTGVRRIAP